MEVVAYLFDDLKIFDKNTFTNLRIRISYDSTDTVRIGVAVFDLKTSCCGDLDNTKVVPRMG